MCIRLRRVALNRGITTINMIKTFRNRGISMHLLNFSSKKRKLIVFNVKRGKLCCFIRKNNFTIVSTSTVSCMIVETHRAILI